MDLSNKRFGRLVVVSEVRRDKHRNIIWLCACDCGKLTEQRSNTLNMGLAQSCGCLKKERARSRMLSEKNPTWKAIPSLGALHAWIRRRKPKPKKCERCKKSIPQDLANISGKYLRDVNDFEWLCRKCHMTDDERIIRRKQNGQFERAKQY